MTTTKEQERKALEKIKKIVDDLGEGSYIGMAFEGCFDVAKNNIEFDLGFSFESEIKSLRKDDDRNRELVKSLMSSVDDLTVKLDNAIKEIAWLRGKILTHECIELLKVLVLNENKKAASQENAAAAKILSLAETPELPEFKEAVRERKIAIQTAAKTEDVMEVLISMQEEKENVL